MDLKNLRGEIDKIDDEIIRLLKKRMAVVNALKNHKSSVTDKEREDFILSKISEEPIQEIYKAIFQASKKILEKPKNGA
jgi:chorismate mutase